MTDPASCSGNYSDIVVAKHRTMTPDLLPVPYLPTCLFPDTIVSKTCGPSAKKIYLSVGLKFAEAPLWRLRGLCAYFANPVRLALLQSR